MNYIIYIPADLARELHEPLRRHYRDDPSVQVVIKRRAPGGIPDESHPPESRRADDRGHWPRRRSAVVRTSAPSSLPPEALPYVEQLEFMAEVDPDTAGVESLRLVARVQEGDAAAFDELYRQHFDGIYRFLVLFLGNPEQAEDVAQEVFLKAHKGLSRYNLHPHASFSSWLLKIAQNEAVSAMRGTRAEPVDPNELAEVSSSAGLTSESERALLMLVEQLPSRRQQQVFMARYMVGLSTAETASAFGLTEDSVRSLAKRARARVLRDAQGLERDWPPHRLAMNRHRVSSPVSIARRTALGPSVPAGG